MCLHYDGKNRPVFLEIHLLQHLPEWARCLILPFPPSLVRGLHSKLRWRAQLFYAGGLVVQFTHQVGELSHQSTYRIRCSSSFSARSAP